MHGARARALAPITDLEPLIDALGVELVTARQHAQQLSTLEVAHADDARRLLATRTLDVTVEAIRRQLLDLELHQTLGLGVAQSLGQVQQRLRRHDVTYDKTEIKRP